MESNQWPYLPRILDIGFQRTCSCPPNHLNCMSPKDWLKSQIGVWQFFYESRDVRDKGTHPAAFPISLARRCIELFTHRGELVLDPFAGSGTTLVAAKDLCRNALGIDLREDYVGLCRRRLEASPEPSCAVAETKQFAICDDSMNAAGYLRDGTVSLVLTSPPYANLLNRKRTNKSRRGDTRFNTQYGAVEQYSQDPRDLGTMPVDEYREAIRRVFGGILPLLKPRSHCVVNVPDMWWEDRRVTLHVEVIAALRSAGYELRNTIIWDRTNIVNRVGIFGWPNNYITMGVTFEYLLDFWRPSETSSA